MTDTDYNKDVITKHTIETRDGIPIIKFMRHPCMVGFFWSDATPFEYGGSGIPIPEHKELYETCVKEGIEFYWTSV